MVYFVLIFGLLQGFEFATTDNYGSEEEASVTITGKIIDQDTNLPVPFAYVHLKEINRASTTNSEGIFSFQNVPPGRYTMNIHRIGYTTLTHIIKVDSGVTESDLVFYLHPRVHQGQDVLVQAERGNGATLSLEHASIKISGQDLRRNLGTTISQTLLNTAGFSERTMGPAPGRPIIRGLDGERVLILQDGRPVGDVSTTSSDHSVTIDPMLAEEIQIARGPAALAFGGNAVGGVVNVIQHHIPTSVPAGTYGTFSMQGATVNTEAAAAAQLTAPLGVNWVGRLNINGRLGNDFASPDGKINNTYIRTTSNSFGLSNIRPWGYIGGAVNVFLSEYGIPPEPEAGHPQGVDIEMQRYTVNLSGEVVSGNTFFKIIEPDVSATFYNHVEIESNGAIGTEFTQFTINGGLKAHHRPWGIFNAGLMGVQFGFTDYRVFGSRTPDSNQLRSAVFIIQEADIGRLHLELGSRFEYAYSFPKEKRVSTVIGNIRSRQHSGLSASTSLIYELSSSLYLGSTILYSYRTPSLEELYSEGPHLAAFMFEIGNPDLNSERGLAKEVFLRHRAEPIKFEVTAFRNYFWRFISSQDTGRQNFRFPNLNDFKFTESSATFYGLEASTEINFTRNLSIGGNLLFTLADREVSDEEREITGFQGTTQPVPYIPPLSGLAFAQYDTRNWTFRAQTRIAAAQNRVSQFETPTNGYQLFDFSIQYILDGRNLLHTIALNAQNITDVKYRNHTSRIKNIFPEPGRNISLLYRMYF